MKRFAEFLDELPILKVMVLVGLVCILVSSIFSGSGAFVGVILICLAGFAWIVQNS